ncbi:oxidoreductase [Stenotrophomonas sp. HITSZ_GD]|uniref:oxidoreductase n=1 Tax=Stenotrophomonas sp. HITSZ_GD TaxID=3037248 RepID=UPI00240E5A12|nr:oxidoreductase [Stenotrophomonas sp. HITSZ_GD]MDG2525575.1 oxidoreductase [Stenotrophomonas sp. HITSZ_GD]
MANKVALVTGASSGIGESAARKLKGLGYTVYGAARRVDRMHHLTKSGIKILAMDVTDDASMRAGIDTIIEESGRIDVLVNNAGYGSYGAVEDVQMEEARAQFEVNVFGAVRLTQLVLPQMRAQHSGTIVNITSMGGKIHTPLGAWYHGTKFALEAISDCMRMEVRPFGIDVVVIEPGGIKTEWAGIAADKLRETSGHGPYAAQAHAMAESMIGEASVKRQSSPQLIADTIAKAVTAKKPKTRYAIGFGAKPTIFMRGLLSDRAFDSMMWAATGISKAVKKSGD